MRDEVDGEGLFVHVRLPQQFRGKVQAYVHGGHALDSNWQQFQRIPLNLRNMLVRVQMVVEFYGIAGEILKTFII